MFAKKADSNLHDLHLLSIVLIYLSIYLSFFFQYTVLSQVHQVDKGIKETEDTLDKRVKKVLRRNIVMLLLISDVYSD